MSMNLNASTKHGKINLWQTPTSGSYTILPPSTGCDVKGKRAKLALEAYIEWVKGGLNGVWTDNAAYENKRVSVEEHLTCVRRYLDDKTLNV